MDNYELDKQFNAEMDKVGRDIGATLEFCKNNDYFNCTNNTMPVPDLFSEPRLTYLSSEQISNMKQQNAAYDTITNFRENCGIINVITELQKKQFCLAHIYPSHPAFNFREASLESIDAKIINLAYWLTNKTNLNLLGGVMALLVSVISASW